MINSGYVILSFFSPTNFYFLVYKMSEIVGLHINVLQDGKTALDISLCYGKDFKSYELAKLLKLVPANRDF